MLIGVTLHELSCSLGCELIIGNLNGVHVYNKFTEKNK